MKNLFEMSIESSSQPYRCCTETYYKIKSRVPLFYKKGSEQYEYIARWNGAEYVDKLNETRKAFIFSLMGSGQEVSVNTTGKQLEDGSWEYTGRVFCDSGD
jgi:hypothetical protein